MSRLIEYGIYICISVILALAYRDLAIIVRRHRLKKSHGCKEPVAYAHTSKIRGSDLLQVRKQAIRDGRLKLLYLDHHRTLGSTWQETVNGGVEINTVSMANIRYVYALRPFAFSRAGLSGSAGTLLFGKGGILADGHEWKWNRKLIDPTFSKYETATMPMLKTHVDRFMQNVPKDGLSFDAQPLMKRLFLDLTTEFLFGEPLGMQLPEKQAEAEDFLNTLDAVVLGLNKRRQNFNLTSVALWFDRSYAANVAKVHAFIDSQVRAALARTSPEAVKSASKKGRYILVDELAAKKRDAKYLRYTMIQCFMPGRDSPAILASNTLFALARHPDLWTRLRSQVLPIDEEELLSFSKLSSLHSVRHAILEAFRMYGPGGRNKRFAAEDVVLPEGGGPDGKSPVFVAKGTGITTFMPVLHRDKAYWGEDADEYRPGRWEGLSPVWEFRPFLAGPRTCPAKDQVMTQVTYIIVRLLREFEMIENKDEVLEFVEFPKLTTESRRGAQIALVPAV